MEFRLWTRLAAHSRRRGEGGPGFQRYDTTAGRGSALVIWFLGVAGPAAAVSLNWSATRDMFSATACQAIGDGRERR